MPGDFYSGNHQSVLYLVHARYCERLHTSGRSKFNYTVKVDGKMIQTKHFAATSVLVKYRSLVGDALGTQTIAQRVRPTWAIL